MEEDQDFIGDGYSDAAENSSHEYSSNDSAVNLSNRDQLRQQLQSEVEAFLASGGKINRIDPNVVADPPKKPESNYGGQPI